MTPLQIEILLHYYCRVDDFPRLDAPAAKEAIEKFCALGILKAPQGDEGAQYKSNRKALDVYIEAIMEVPLPEQRWIIPSPFPK